MRHVAVIILCLVVTWSLACLISTGFGAEWAMIQSGVGWDEPRCVRQTTDGGYIVAGETSSVRKGFRDVWLVKMHDNGEVAWEKTYGGTDPREDAKAFFVEQTTDGGYIVAGRKFSLETDSVDFLVMKIDAVGSIDWQKAYGGSALEIARSVQQTTDGGYVVAGTTRSFGSGGVDAWVLRLNGDGTVQWQKTYGGTEDEKAFAIQETDDGGFVVAGYTDSYSVGLSDVWVLKLDGDGSVVWQKAYGGDFIDEAFSIQQTSEGGYVLAGNTNSIYRTSPADDIWVYRLVHQANFRFRVRGCRSYIDPLFLDGVF